MLNPCQGVASMGMIMQDLQDLLAVSYEQMRSLSASGILLIFGR